MKSWTDEIKARNGTNVAVSSCGDGSHLLLGVYHEALPFGVAATPLTREEVEKLRGACERFLAERGPERAEVEAELRGYNRGYAAGRAHGAHALEQFIRECREGRARQLRTETPSGAVVELDPS